MTELYRTAADFTGTGLIPYFAAIESAVPGFFSIVLFVIWMFGTAGVYFTILSTTGKKRFFPALTSLSFVTFLLSLLVTAMNNTEVTFLTGYWIGFYILMTVVSYFLLDNYN